MSSGTEIGWLTNCEYTLAQEWWTPTPLLSTQVAGQRLGIDLWLKREASTPIGSFKLRGALVCMDILNSGLPKAGVYVASAGNYGIAIAVAGRRRRIPVKVFAPVGATPSKLERIRLSGATLITVGDDFDTAKSVAREAAIEDGAVFWEDGVVPQMSQGAATIGTEILRQGDEWDLVLVPLGNGSLIKGVATAFKSQSPRTRVIGLVPSGAPSMAQAMLGQAWCESRVDTYADGLAVRIPILPIVEELKTLVDEVWVVDESKLLPAVKSLLELEQIVAEPSAAISLAGLYDHREQICGKKVVAVLTGSLLNMDLIHKVLGGDALF